MSKVIKILNTELVKIYDTGHEYQVLITMSRGGTVEHEPFPKSLQGLVSAMQIATEILAGKFFIRQVVETQTAVPLIEKQTLLVDDVMKEKRKGYT